MNLIAEGILKFGDRKASLYEAKDGRHYVKIVEIGTSKSSIEWLPEDDYLNWVKSLENVKKLT